MIQRIQSVWLFLASLTIISLLLFPMVTVNAGGVEHLMYACGLYQKTGANTVQIQSYLPLMISTIAVSLICFANIFNFRNRANQKMVTIISILLIIGLSFWTSRYAQQIPGGLENANYNFGMFAPVIAILFCVLAIRGINKDEKLIKSADRLR